MAQRRGPVDRSKGTLKTRNAGGGDAEAAPASRSTTQQVAPAVPAPSRVDQERTPPPPAGGFNKPARRRPSAQVTGREYAVKRSSPAPTEGSACLPPTNSRPEPPLRSTPPAGQNLSASSAKTQRRAKQGSVVVSGSFAEARPDHWVQTPGPASECGYGHRRRKYPEVPSLMPGCAAVAIYSHGETSTPATQWRRSPRLPMRRNACLAQPAQATHPDAVSLIPWLTACVASSFWPIRLSWGSVARRFTFPGIWSALSSGRSGSEAAICVDVVRAR